VHREISATQASALVGVVLTLALVTGLTTGSLSLALLSVPAFVALLAVILLTTQFFRYKDVERYLERYAQRTQSTNVFENQAYIRHLLFFDGKPMPVRLAVDEQGIFVSKYMVFSFMLHWTAVRSLHAVRHKGERYAELQLHGETSSGRLTVPWPSEFDRSVPRSVWSHR
jgi:hypothetical protein